MKWRLERATWNDDVARQWDEINDSHIRSPVLCSDFVAPALRGPAGENAWLARCEHEGATVAMGLLCRRDAFRWETLQPAQAPLGFLLWREGVSLADAAESLLDALPGMAMLLSVTQQDPEVVARPERENVSTVDYIETPYITLPESFDAYWASRGKNLRHNIRRQRNLLARNEVRTSLDVITEPGQMADAVASYGEIETRGWKGEEGTAVTPGNAQGAYYRSMLEAFAATGDGFVFRYRYNDRIVAVDLCIRRFGTFIILKTTYDEAEQGSSPAILLRHDYFPVVFGWGDVRRIEFFGRTMEWHRRWTSETRQMFHVNTYRWPILRTLHEQRIRSASTGTAPSAVAVGSGERKTA